MDEGWQVWANDALLDLNKRIAVLEGKPAAAAVGDDLKAKLADHGIHLEEPEAPEPDVQTEVLVPAEEQA